MKTKPIGGKDHPALAYFDAAAINDYATLGYALAAVCELYRSRGAGEAQAVLRGVRGKLEQAGKPKEMLNLLTGLAGGLQDMAEMETARAHKHQ
ncbi:hypothetical protein WK59_09385 [Burkholderia ubonensis]|uniref:hypothetical protein n=1 Tax=Burkholderia ubonensis TaxID=101571 RepID=UPI00075C74D8|nr:hypothetical protein [Burkholderia ubonensis]KVT87485.1 hypothetical protein WK59_09385 [Burkholderia ubonensis]KVX90833.1 hypothetical protein WL10_13445 [Burkholderia ubonensis]